MGMRTAEEVWMIKFKYCTILVAMMIALLSVSCEGKTSSLPPVGKSGTPTQTTTSTNLENPTPTTSRTATTSGNSSVPIDASVAIESTVDIGAQLPEGT